MRLSCALTLLVTFRMASAKTELATESAVTGMSLLQGGTEDDAAAAEEDDADDDEGGGGGGGMDEVEDKLGDTSCFSVREPCEACSAD